MEQAVAIAALLLLGCRSTSSRVDLKASVSSIFCLPRSFYFAFRYIQLDGGRNVFQLKYFVIKWHFYALLAETRRRMCLSLRNYSTGLREICH
jgi:hypothetical protein